MKICHIALGGCITAPDVSYGITEDTGGHIAYILGAAGAQAQRRDVTGVEIVTRAFDAPELGSVYGLSDEIVGPKLRIARLRTDNPRYLSKEALAHEVAALSAAFVERLRDPALRPDVIHAHFADAAEIAEAAHAAYGIPFVYTPHSLGIDKRNCAGQTACPQLDHRIDQERRALENAHGVIVSSRDEAERQIAAYGVDVAGQVHRVAPGAALCTKTTPAAGKSFLAPHLADLKKPLILAIARPVARKNLAALARVYMADPGLQERANLVILAGQHGPGARPNDEARAVLDELQSLLAPAIAAKKAALPESHTQSDVVGLYRFASESRGVFVNPAFHEPFGLTILEAATQGLPVVATCQCGPGEIIATLGHGACIDPGCDRSIHGALKVLLGNAVVWEQKSSAAQKVHQTYRWSQYGRTSVEIYRTVRDAKTTPHRARQPYLLACDIDATLTGCTRAAARFAAWVGQSGAGYAVATGRSMSEARRVLRDWSLPEPMLFVTSVGSEIYLRAPDGRFRRDAAFAAHLDRSWDRAALARLIAQSGVKRQLDVEQRPWKLSCFGGVADAKALEQAIALRGLAAKVILSHDKFIDILPVDAGKYAALCWAAGRLDLSPDDLIVAGDSGNDRDMLSQAQRAILVANALPELKTLADMPSIYRAESAHADGVLEGLAHFCLARSGAAQPQAQS